MTYGWTLNKENAIKKERKERGKGKEEALGKGGQGVRGGIVNMRRG